MQLKTGFLALTTLVASLCTGCATVRPCSNTMPSAQKSERSILTPYRVEAADKTCLQAFEWQPPTPRPGAPWSSFTASGTTRAGTRRSRMPSPRRGSRCTHRITGATATQAVPASASTRSRVKVPLLILHGGTDKATNVEGSKELAARAGSTDKTLRIYESVYHDLMHEPERDAIIAEVSSWITAQLGDK